MAIVIAYDRMGTGLNMLDTDVAFAPASTLVPDAEPAVSKYDSDTYLISQWFEGFQLNIGIYASPYAGDTWTLEGIYAFDADLNPLTSFTDVNIRFSLTDDFSAGVIFTNLYSGNDEIYGNRYSDWIKAGAGRDFISGNGGGNDRLFGEAGSDTIYGGAGKDTSTGGSGADIFIYVSAAESSQSPQARDKITDFNRPQGDKIDLSLADAKTGGTANDSFSFVNKAPASAGAASNGKLWYASGVLYGSTDPDVAPEFSVEVTLVGITSSNATNYIFL